ncbi:peptidase M16 inactive domain protein [Neorickettsia helminthoeca str. Oregon]|uniref:Peptidase M16 inactive domain protein n=1 Tax=Neorickettsia helminthoeca str. Oregon TaxID=1286528 RepID=X5H517_9RICK|nr:pitrilysin family protein [Neorickettsia helminthoeca]AHX11788.1 peptidase M16 inactive domain protein [Neorickettsia helminthoeca str. Oregon]
MLESVMRNFLCCFALGILTLIGSPGCAERLEKVHYTLGNGLSVYLIRDGTLPIVSHVLLYKVGSANDLKGKSGVAHYLEHLMFRSSKNIQNISKEIDKLNSVYNAFTSDYRTVYYELVNKNKLEKVMQLEAERMVNLAITDEAVELERKIVLEERRMRLDNKPLVRLSEEMYAAFYRNDTAWNTIGWEQEILSLNQADAQQMYQKYYQPSQAVLVILGDIDINKVKGCVNKYYGVIPNLKTGKDSSNVVPLEPEHRADITVKMLNSMNEERNLIYLFEAPNISDKSHFATLVAAQILAGGKLSVLGTELTHNLRLALDVSVDYDYLTKRKGIVEIVVTPLSPDVKLEVLESSVSRILADVLRSGIANEDIEVAKAMLKVSLMKALDGFKARSISYVDALSVGADFDYFEKLADQIASVTPEQINIAITSLLNSKKVIGYLDK